MLGGLIGFVNPWLLGALALLPAIWWLLRTTPPAPRLLRFPPILLLLGLAPKEETPARTPWWLVLLRLAIASLVILALAGPILHPEPRPANGPLVLVVDDGWAAAPGWSERIEVARRHLERAAREGRASVLARTAPDPTRPALEQIAATDALAGLGGWTPRSWPVDRAAAAEDLAGLELEDAEIVWLTDGVTDREGAAAGARDLASALQGLGTAVTTYSPEALPSLVRSATAAADSIGVVVERADAAGPGRATLRAIGAEGDVLRLAEAGFADGAQQAEVTLDLPIELRNRIVRIELTPLQSAGGVLLSDETWQRRVVGLATAGQPDQPLLGELYYVERALTPFAELRRAPVDNLLAQELSLIVLPDGAGLDSGSRAGLEDWVEAGGALVRFAGPRLAETPDDLVPVPLRAGQRNLGGTLSWARPLPLAGFAAESPLAGLPLPNDVIVRQQILAQPGPELVERTWAELADGTPLVTGARRGDGWLVLVHTTANAAWSDLAISGTFVEMLHRLLDLGHGVAGAPEDRLQLVAMLDAAGRLVDPPSHAQPIEPGAFADTVAGPEHPPGQYAPIGADAEAPRHALNLASAVDELRPLDPALPPGTVLPYRTAGETQLLPWLLTAALMLALLDMLIGLALRGLLPRLGRRAPASATVLLALLCAPAAAQDDARALETANQTRLGYVRTGINQIDANSHAGLVGLGLVLGRRTTIETGEPVPVDLATDDLSLIPLLYWPVPPEAPDLAPATRDRVAEFLARGGLILFDTLDAGQLVPGTAADGPGARRLREILGDMSLPPLMPVPADHVLTKSFYLLQEFPGRWTGQPVWLDEGEQGVNDGVASVVIGAHDWAAAWAVDERSEPMYAVTPGGERQREMARRFGVNLVMYALTGNYKSDQVHVPALLERLGQ